MRSELDTEIVNVCCLYHDRNAIHWRQKKNKLSLVSVRGAKTKSPIESHPCKFDYNTVFSFAFFLSRSISISVSLAFSLFLSLSRRLLQPNNVILSVENLISFNKTCFLRHQPMPLQYFYVTTNDF